MTPEEVLQYVGSKVGGDPSRAIYGTRTVEVDNPDPRLRDKPGQEKITVTVERWETPDGKQVIFEGYRDPSNPTQFKAMSQPPVAAAAQPLAAPPTEKDEGGRHWIWSPNPNGQGGQWVDVGAATQKTPPQERVNPADPTKRQTWNPTTGAWEDSGSVAPDAARPPTERVNPEDPTKRQVWNPQGNGGKGAWEDAGAVAQDASRPPTERANPEDPTKRQRWDPTANGGKGDWVDAGGIYKEPPKPTLIDDPNNPGGKLSVIPDPSQPAGVRIEKVTLPGQASGTGTPPGITPGASLGTITNSFNAVLQKIWNDPNMTWAQKEQAATVSAQLHKQLADETTTILTNQQNTFTNLATQRNQDVVDQTNRRTWLGNLQQNAFENAAKLAPYAPAGSDIAGNAYLGQIMLGFKLADAMGALKLPERVQPGAAAQQVYGQGVPVVGNTTTIKPDGTTVIQHAPAPPASVQAAAQPPPQVNFSNVPVPEGAGVSGGQLAVRNAPDMPDWLSGWGQ